MTIRINRSDPAKAALDAVNAEIEEKRREAQTKWAAFEEARKDFAKSGRQSTDSSQFKKAEHVHGDYKFAAEELAQLEQRRDRIFRTLAGNAGSGGVGKSIGEQAASGESYRQLMQSGALSRDHQQFHAKLAEMTATEFKTVISSGTQGTFVAADHVGIAPQPQRPLRLLDVCNIGQTSSDTIEFARQTTTTNYAAEVVEATTTTTGTKPEATIPFEKITAYVQTLAHWVPATRRSLADSDQLVQVINTQLIAGLLDRLEDQIISGNGTAPNLQGILNTSGILTQAKGSDSVADCIHKGITQLRLGHVEPSAVVLHPNDWQALRLARDDGGATAGTGSYLYGAPSEAGQPSIWGIPAIVTVACPDDTIIVGDWQQLGVWVREAPIVLATDSHSDYFTRNLVAVLAEMRAGAAVFQPASFVKCTSID